MTSYPFNIGAALIVWNALAIVAALMFFAVIPATAGTLAMVAGSVIPVSTMAGFVFRNRF